MLDALRGGPAAAPGIVVTPGKAVLDLAVTEMSKGLALDRMRGDAAVFFAGDDVTDETAFARLRPGDVGVKVGDGDTAAANRSPTRRRWRTCWADAARHRRPADSRRRPAPTEPTGAPALD